MNPEENEVVEEEVTPEVEEETTPEVEEEEVNEEVTPEVEEDEVNPSEEVKQNLFEGKVIVSDGMRVVNEIEYHHVKLEDGSSHDLTDEQYQLQVVVANQ
jgi:hypothetical protein